MLAAGSTSVSISSVNGRRGGCAMVRPFGRRDIAVGWQRRAVELQRDERQPIAVEHQRGRSAGRRIGLQLERRAHRRLRRMQLDVEIDGFDQPIGRPVFGQADGTGFFGAHHVVVGAQWRGVGRDLSRRSGQSYVARSRSRAGIACAQQQRLPGGYHDPLLQFRLSVLHAAPAACRGGSSSAPRRRAWRRRPRSPQA